jgi:hypothetical protein
MHELLDGERVRQLWKLLAYLGRYGHQPVNVLRRMPLSEIYALRDGVAEIVEEENRSNREPSMDG